MSPLDRALEDAPTQALSDWTGPQSRPWQDLLFHWDEHHGGVQIWGDFGLGLVPYSETTSQLHEGLTPIQLQKWTLRVLEAQGQSWDSKKPMIDAILPQGIRLHAVFSPIVRGMTLSLRRSSRRVGQVQIASWANDPAWSLLSSQVLKNQNILISGATGAGKTTLMNDLLDQVPLRQRIVTLEDTPEIKTIHTQRVALFSRAPNADGFGEVTLRDLVKQTLRMRPDRIVLGECRGVEVLELLQVLNCGHRGTLATLHANSTRDCLRRVELLCLLHGPSNLQPATVRELLATSVDIVVQVIRTGGGRRIARVDQLAGVEGAQILLRCLYQAEPVGSGLENTA